MRRLSPLFRHVVSARRLCTKAAEPEVGTSTVDPAEIAKFAAQAAQWWHPDGAAAPLHRMNPLRVSYIRAALEKHVNTESSAEALREKESDMPLAHLSVLDVGCGGMLKKVFFRFFFRGVQARVFDGKGRDMVED